MQETLSARERQIMDAVHRIGTASAREIQEAIPSPPSYSAVRTLIRILEEKGNLTHREEAGRYLYSAVVTREKAGLSAMRKMLATFFDNSTERALQTLLSSKETAIDEEELDRLSAMIDSARRTKREEKGEQS